MVLPLAAKNPGRLYRGDRFSCSVPAPATSSRHPYTGHRRGHIQKAPRLRAHRSEPLSRDHPQIPVSMPSLFHFDASAVVHTCSSSHRTPAPLTARRQPQRSPPRLLTDAACGGLESPPARRPRRTYLHHWHSTDRADDLLHRHHFPSGHTWVPKTRPWALTCNDAGRSSFLVYRILYRFLASLARLTVRSRRSKDLEIIVRRHQLGVLHRRNNRPQLADEDRALLGAVAAALSRPQRAGWLVTPETLLRWHRRRTARHWTQPSRTPGRPSTATSLRGHQQPHLGLPPNHRRTRWPRSPRWSLHRVENPRRLYRWLAAGVSRTSSRTCGSARC